MAGPAIAASAWDDSANDCIRKMGDPASSEMRPLLACADAFSADARVDKLSSSDKTAIETGLHWLLDHGDKTGVALARDGYVRLGKPVPASSNQPQTNAPPPRQKYDPKEVSDADQKAAEKMAEEAVKLLKKKKWAEGVKGLEAALDKDPRSQKALYNLACGEANIDAKRPKALLHLQYLSDLGDEESAKRLVRARGDEDFASLRDNPEFKRLTGYARIQIVNTIGTPGDKGAENIQKLLDKLEFRKVDVRDEDNPLDHPVVVFREHAKPTVSLIASLLDTKDVHPVLEPMKSEGKYDIVIRWGTKVADGKPLSLGPDTADEAIAEARKKQNKVLAQPDAALNKVNKVLNAPDHAYNEGAAAVNRVETTVNKAKGALDKAKSIGDKLNKL